MAGPLVPGDDPLNLADPQLSYQYKSALDVRVANPFFGLPATVMPGQLRSQSTVALGTLLIRRKRRR